MKKTAYLWMGCLLLVSCSGDQPDGSALLDSAIAYHDPGSAWTRFRDSLHILMETPDATPRRTHLFLDLPGNIFYAKATRDTITTEYWLAGDSCTLRLNGRTSFSEEEAAAHRLDCETAGRIRDYYSYLYGLPMKLKDQGTLIADEISERAFEGKDYLVLEARYDPSVGSDVWYFYFDPETYALELYQFYHTDDSGNILPESGEFILLSGELQVGGIRMPKVRAWYTNKDSTYLGTDYLQE
jgi:hypothetical protein